MHKVFYLIISTLLFHISTFGITSSKDSLLAILENENPSPDVKIEILLLLAKSDFGDEWKQNEAFAGQALDLATKNKNWKPATDALDLLITLSNQNGDPQAAVEFALEAIKLAKENNSAGDEVYFSNLCGTANLNAGNYYSALEHYQYASQLAHKNEWFITESSTLNNIGAIYCYLGDELKGLEFFIEALKIKEENNETKNLSGALINIGGIYVIMGDHDEGLTFLNRALNNAREIQDSYAEAKALISIGDLYIKLDKSEEAQTQYFAALFIVDSIQDFQTKVNVLDKIGDTYTDLGNLEKAFNYYTDALNLSDSMDYYFGISLAGFELGNYYVEQADYKKALYYFNKSTAASEKINASLKTLNSYEALSMVYKKLNKPELALDYYTKYVAIEDSLFRQENQEKYSSIKALYEVDKKQQELDNLRLENEISELEARQSRYLLYGSFGLTLLIILLVILIFRQQKVRSLQKTIRLEQKLLRSQINPHFIFNALTAVQRFIFEKSTLLASDYLGKFSKLIRFILNSSTVDKIPLSDEIEFLENYLSLQVIRFDEKFKFDILVDDEIEAENILIPPMLTQPIVENAVEHGVQHLSGNGKILIHYQLENDKLKIMVEDNGIGREKSEEINARKNQRHKSLSTSITNERLLHLNKGFNENISLEYVDLINDKNEPAGTKVIINIPIDD